ncbi:hypothetical protein PTTG_07492 [Puccinia triticina 1-1 BBBD Race 1]|uniref:Uncharacterized protein n=2 Tax=Puccinia triticina TaxID=208348 RepID=A0A180GX09_PUCT1|nr:uncharacterized protein PtA15_6A368 [Puccinia triticina]OAV96888.1 hypothetical protein PTTG_07492 [Puccinia triticina 1-1 BBBD Race 1]WAQ85739.1 hypothetical protein PtA15_6A368 [Puccinia triticina]WAR55613.1 hypothetical protein PtB15_6B356 [Puccinia triticina]
MPMVLPVQLHISLNARLFKIFNLTEHRAFTISHLRKTLGTSFHISPEKIRFNLVSGRYTRDTDALFDLRASDGNSASLDVELPPAYVHSSLSNGVISMRFLSNVGPVVSEDTLCENIVEVQLLAPTTPSTLPSSSTAPAPFSLEELSREQRIALRAQLEDPFSIASKSCFEDDSDDDDDYNDDDDDSDSDVDDDLYSDDGEAVFESASSDSDCSSTTSSLLSSPVTSPTSSSFWPSDPSKLSAGHLRHLLSITTPRDSRREIHLRVSLLRYKFQQRILERLQDGPKLSPSNPLENLKLTPAIQTSPLPTSPTSATTKVSSAVPSSLPAHLSFI